MSRAESARPVDDLMRSVVSFEWDRMERLRAQTAFQAALALAFAGGIRYVFDAAPSESGALLVFEACRWGAFVGMGAQVVCLIRAWYGYAYKYLPQPAVIQQQFDEISVVYERHAREGSADALAAAEFNKRLAAVHVEMAQRNHVNNNRRSGWLHRARLALILSLIPLSLPLVASNLPNVTPHGREETRVKETVMADEPEDQSPEIGPNPAIEPVDHVPPEELPPAMSPQEIKEAGVDNIDVRASSDRRPDGE